LRGARLAESLARAWLQPSEKWQNLIAPQLFAQHRGASLVDTVHLEHILRQVQTNRDDPHCVPPHLRQATSPGSTVSPACSAPKGASIPLTVGATWAGFDRLCAGSYSVALSV
jgi:hypothetical protein